MNIIMSNELGTVTFTKRVISDIAYQVALKCYGIVGMASRNKKDGIVSLLKSDNSGKGVDIIDSGTEEGIIVELHIIVQYGVNITTVCQSIAHRVRYTLEKTVGTKIKSVNVRVEGIRVSE